DGRGIVSCLELAAVQDRPGLFSTVLMWLLAELFEELPEVGDPEKPRLVFFFDEAHLLFEDAPKALVDKVEQVVRLIRSKGVGVYFVTQNPLDVPESVLAQLGNRVQHALRAFTPRDQRAVRVAAETFRQNPRIDTATAITELGVGEALVSLLDEKGRPGIVEQALIRPPDSRLGTITPAERAETIGKSPAAGRYDRAIDRESAFERLRARHAAPPRDDSPPAPAPAAPRGRAAARGPARGGPWSEPAPPPDLPDSGPWTAGPTAPGRAPRRTGAARTRQTPQEAFLSSMARSVGSAVGRQIVRGVLGSILRR
ncbi:MAG: helicase HerA-like domain-containing protein, partial [Alphaproteobacteria bacterium]